MLKDKYLVGDRVIVNTAFGDTEYWGDRGTIDEGTDRNGWYLVRLDPPHVREHGALPLCEHELDKEEPLKVGDRVWCFPHQHFCGFEAEIAYIGKTDVAEVSGPSYPGIRLVRLNSMVKFDENHNQKRAYRRGKEIQFRSRGDDCDWTHISDPRWLPEYEYRIAPAKAPMPKPKKTRAPKDGAWLEHDGCPVSPVAPTTLVDVKVRRGDVLFSQPADIFDWSHLTGDSDMDIVKYRGCQVQTVKVNDFTPPAPGEYQYATSFGNNRMHDTSSGYEVPVFLGDGAKKLVDANPKGEFGRKKIPHSCVPQNVSALVAVGMSEGRNKYGRHNYRGIDIMASDYYDATRRHIDAYWEGENDDPDSQLPHVIKAICSLYVLADCIQRGNVIDDRPPASPKNWIKDANEDVARLLDKAKAAYDAGAPVPNHFTNEGLTMIEDSEDGPHD